MKRLLAFLLGASLSAMMVYPSIASIYIPLAVNADGTYDSEYPLGNKPVTPAASCSTWTCAQIGVASGEIDETSATELAFSASGDDDIDDFGFAYKTFASGNVQVCATVPDQANWTGYKENFTYFGVRCQEGLSPPTWFVSNRLVNLDDTPRLKWGTPISDSTSQGDVATVAPEKLCITYQDSASEFKAWQSNDGSTYTQIGSAISRDAASLNCGVFGSSQEAGQTTFASPTGITASSTITIFNPATPPVFNAGPTVGAITSSTIPLTFTVDQTGTVPAVACQDGQAVPTSADIKAGDCTGGVNAAAIFNEPVVATVADGSSFTGLTALTTYDLYFFPNSTANGDAAAITTVANQTTLTGGGGGGTGTCTSSSRQAGNTPSGSGLSLTAEVLCGDTNDIVSGWDWSNPVETNIASRGGIFGVDGGMPSYFKGNLLFKCDAQWDEIETSNNVFDWNPSSGSGDSPDGCIAKIGTGNPPNRFDGVLMNPRGTAAELTTCAGAPAFEENETSPQWVINITGLIDLGCHPNGHRIKALNINNSTILAHYVDFINQFAARYQNENIWLVEHVSSDSRGEECCSPASNATVDAIAQAWINAFSQANRYKLAWLKEDPRSAFDISVNNGAGVRGGIIENWLKPQYTPGQSATSGQILDANGYLTIDPNFAPISENRHWMDENEACAKKTTGSENIERCYLASTLRAMQMRRNILWVDGGRNDRLTDYYSTMAGKTAATTSEGFVWLMETTAPSGATVNNLERHVLQREALGATTPTNDTPHGYNAAGNGSQPPLADRDARWSRRENNASDIIGFALEDAFWATSLTQNVVFKITYIDTGNLTLTIRNAAGTPLATIAVNNTGGVKTATRFVSNFNAGASGVNKDFDIQSSVSGAGDIIFVRVIKNGTGHAVW